MKKIKKFLDKRSKLSLLVFLVSIIISILLVLEFTNYCEYISLISNFQQTSINLLYEYHSILEIIYTNEFIYSNIIVCSILVFICLYNMVGYLYNKSEFMFISTGLYVILFCLSLYIFNISGIILIACLLVLNLLGYIDQIKLSFKKR